MNDKVVFLAFSNNRLQDDSISMFACVVCRNKTYKIINDGQDKYPLLRCAACDGLIGRIGWTDE